jgi:hypothetical protein
MRFDVPVPGLAAYLARVRHGDRAALGPDGLGPRRNGISLPGDVAGRFGGRSGDRIDDGAGGGAGFDSRELLFVAVTDGKHLVYLPARHGQSLSVSVQEGEALLQALYRSAPAGAAQVGMHRKRGVYQTGWMLVQ